MSTQPTTIVKGAKIPRRRREAAGKSTAKQTKKNRKRNRTKKPVVTGDLGKTVNVALQAGDARIATSEAKDVSLSNQTTTIKNAAFFDPESLIWVSSGYISRALEKGYLGEAQAMEYAYYAWLYLMQVLFQFLNGGQPALQQLPYWLLCLGRAIQPKEVSFRQGKVNYALISADQQVAPQPGIVVTPGYQSYGYQWSTAPANPVAPPVNGFPVLNLAIGGYSEANGQLALQDVFAFMAANINDPALSGAHALVPIATETTFDQDVSAFSEVQNHLGFEGSGLNGGIVAQAQLEVPIFRPMLANFNGGITTQPQQLSNRNFNWATQISGGPCFLGGSIGNMFSMRQMGSKICPKFHFVDFLEFLEVVALWLQGIIQAYLNDQINIAPTSETLVGLTCPLSLLEVGLVLRNIMMGAFKSTQAAAQFVAPFTPQSGTDNQFQPFYAASNTCFYEMTDMQLPIPILENIKALSGKKAIYGKAGSSAAWWVPVLGQYALDTLSQGDFMASINIVDQPPIVVPVFTTPAFKERRKTGKGTEEMVSLAEVPIQYVDGASATNLVAINNPEQLNALTSLFNNWLTTSGVQQYSVTTGVMNQEEGIAILSSVTMTRHTFWNAGSVSTRVDDTSKTGQAVDVTLHSRVVSRRNSVGLVNVSIEHNEKPDSKKVRMENFQDPRFFNNKVMIASPYTNRSVQVESSQGVIIAPAYENVIRWWILPINRLQVNAVAGESAQLQKMQFIQGEPYAISTTDNSTQGQLLSTMHVNYAAKLVRAKLAQETDISQLFNDMAKTGRGGILSSLAGDLLDSIPVVGPLLKSFI